MLLDDSAPPAGHAPPLGAGPGVGAGGRLGDAHPPPPWPAPRLAAVQALWGAGFVSPGGAPETLRLAKPMGLSPKVTLLLLGGGLGGPAQAIVDGFGAWVDSFEADPDLCAIAVDRQKRHDRAGHIRVGGWNRAAPQFLPGSANHVLALEALRGAPMAPMLTGLAGALRPHGHIVLTEMVADTQPNPADREYAAWCRLDLRAPGVPCAAELSAQLAALGFDVRVVEDMTERHMSATLGGWRDAVRAMETGTRTTAHGAAAMVGEAEIWLLRLRLMRRMGLKLMRWHAIAAA